jgi:MoxR-like ATPase
MLTHIVQLAITMGNKGSGRQLSSLSANRRTRRRSLICHYRPITKQASSIRICLDPFFHGITMLRTTLSSDSPSAGPLDQLMATAGKVILGKEKEIRLAVACLLAGGHLLIEDLPGLGKTTLAHTLARLFGLQFSRIQFTSDLLPADIIGVSVYEREKGEFRFVPGPIFSQLVLADEINRATPKTQSALLEAMEESQVTTEGLTRPLPQPFFVIATQNPSHQIGTFPLPESQLDRFLMRIELGYPNPQAEHALLSSGNQRRLADTLAACITPDALTRLQEQCQQIIASPALIDYVQALLATSRKDPAFAHGLSPRAGLALLSAARGLACLSGRNMVLPDDVQACFPAVARHRLRSSQDGKHASAEQIEDLMRRVAIP